jgi:DNA-binding response OmpR family regulator
MSEWRSRIAVVDEEERTRGLIGELLQREGFHVTLAANAEDALATCYRLEPHLVLLDVTLPEESGFQLARVIKSARELSPSGSPPAILLLTGRRLEPVREYTLRQFYGTDGVFYKPFEGDAVVHATPAPAQGGGTRPRSRAPARGAGDLNLCQREDVRARSTR